MYHVSYYSIISKISVSYMCLISYMYIIDCSDY